MVNIFKLLSLMLLVAGIAGYAINYQTPGIIPQGTLILLLVAGIALTVLATILKALQSALLAGLSLLALGMAVWSGWVHSTLSPLLARIPQTQASLVRPEHFAWLEKMLILLPAAMLIITLLAIVTRPGIRANITIKDLVAISDKPSKKEPDIILCKSLQGKPVVHRWLDRCLHTLIVGPTGAGKTSRVLKPMIGQDIERIKNGTKMSVILIEPKGDFVDDVAGMCKEMGVPCIYINPESPDTLRFNPLEGDDDTVAETTRTVLRNMFGRQEAFFAQAQETHAKMTVKLVKALRKDELNLLDLVRVLSDQEELRSCLVEYKNQIKGDDDLSRYFEHEALGKGGDKLQQFAMGLRLQLGDITSNKLLQKVFIGKSDINLDRLLEQGGVFVVSTSMGRLGRLGDMFGAFAILHICSAVFRRPGNEFSRIPSVFYIDEFARYLNKDIERLLAIGRSYRCACIMAFQSVNQLNTDETRGFKDMILDIPRNLIVFGGIKAFDAKYFSEEFGEVEIEEAQKTYKRDALIFWRHDSSRDTRQFKRRYPYTYLQELPANRIIYRIVDRGNPMPPAEAIVERLDEQNSRLSRVLNKLKLAQYKSKPALKESILLQEYEEQHTADTRDAKPAEGPNLVPSLTIQRNHMPRRNVTAREDHPIPGRLAPPVNPAGPPEAGKAPAQEAVTRPKAPSPAVTASQPVEEDPFFTN